MCAGARRKRRARCSPFRSGRKQQGATPAARLRIEKLAPKTAVSERKRRRQRKRSGQGQASKARHRSSTQRQRRSSQPNERKRRRQGKGSGQGQGSEARRRQQLQFLASALRQQRILGIGSDGSISDDRAAASSPVPQHGQQQQ